MERGLGDVRTKTVLDLISAASVSPGAGAAAAIALALGAACASKAVTVTLKHSPGEETLVAYLLRLERLRDVALEGADKDAHDFKEFLQAQTAGSALRLATTDEHVVQLAGLLTSTIDALEPSVLESMKGDLMAARTLAHAARSIQIANEKAARAAASRLSRESASAIHDKSTKGG